MSGLVSLFLCKVCGMQYNGQTNNEFRYRWNTYKDNNRKSLRGEIRNKQAFLLTFKQLATMVLSFDTEIRFIDETDPSNPTRCEDIWIDTLKTRYPQGLNNIDPHH